MSHITHLARRFFGSFRARRPRPGDQAFVARVLSPTQSAVFWTQPLPDLAHAIRSAYSVLDTSPDRTDLARAALLHDVGKRHSGIGTLRRSLATGLALLRLPVRGRMAIYLDHAEIGAVELAGLGCEELVVLFARHHHGRKPSLMPSQDWDLLLAADDE